MKELSEEQHQNRAIKWARASRGKYPELKWLHCSLNGVRLTPQQRGRAKNMGMEEGIADLVLPVKRGEYGQCWIEMKIIGGAISKAQHEFKAFVEGQGQYHNFCYSDEEAISTIKWYLELVE